MDIEVKCPYCDNQAKFIKGEYSKWECLPCDARVGVHKGTKNPLGHLADEDRRHTRMRAHQAFDAIWKGDIPHFKRTRKKAYSWLADKLGIPVHKCHIAQMTDKNLDKTITICLGLLFD